jgi:hypothetical protein
MKKSTLLCAAIAAPLLIAFRPADEKISFHPVEGTSVTKTFTNTMTYGLDNMEVLMNGEENAMMPDIEMDMETISSITVTDTYGKVTDARPASLTRAFDEVSTEISMDMSADGAVGAGMGSPTGSGTSPLEGKAVNFVWSDDEGEYVVNWTEDNEDEDEDLLTNLVEDMDARGLLPTRDLAIGDSYDIALVSLIDVLAPGGDLKLDVEMDGMDSPMGPTGDPQMMSNLREMFGDMLEGKATGTLREVREIDEAKIAVIGLDIQVDTANDMSEMLMDIMGSEMPEGMELSLDRVDVEFALEAKGELLWNITAGHIHSLSIEGDSAMAMDMEMGMDFGGQSMTIEMSMEMSGTLESTITVE